MDKTQTTRQTKLTFASSFSKPVHAVFQGEPVKITHAGDAQGQSPVYNIVDSKGQSAWVSQSEVLIIDQDYLPMGRETLENLTASTRGLAASGRSSS